MPENLSTFSIISISGDICSFNTNHKFLFNEIFKDGLRATILSNMSNIICHDLEGLFSVISK